MSGMLSLLFFIILGTSYMVSSARVMNITDDMGTQVNYWISHSEIQHLKGYAKNERFCTLCEEFASMVVDYLSQYKMQTEIINAFHQACSHLQSLKEQCVLLVDYYAPLFSQEVGLVSPDKFFTKVNLCNEASQNLLLRRDDTCAMCHDIVSGFLAKLKDPDTEMKIIESLLKLCDTVEQYTQQCKKLVFEYAPIILIDVEKYLEKTDICMSIHACKSNEAAYLSEQVHQYA